MVVKDIAARTGVSASAVRYYARIGLLKPFRSPENNYQLFTRSDEERLRFIREARALGLTLSEIQELLRQSVPGSVMECPRAAALLHHHLQETSLKIRELEALQRRIREVLPCIGADVRPADGEHRTAPSKGRRKRARKAAGTEGFHRWATAADVPRIA